MLDRPRLFKQSTLDQPAPTNTYGAAPAEHISYKFVRFRSLPPVRRPALLPPVCSVPALKTPLINGALCETCRPVGLVTDDCPRFVCNGSRVQVHVAAGFASSHFVWEYSGLSATQYIQTPEHSPRHFLWGGNCYEESRVGVMDAPPLSAHTSQGDQFRGGRTYELEDFQE